MANFGKSEKKGVTLFLKKLT